MSVITTRLFTWRQILVYTAVFVAGFVVVQRALRFTSANWIAFDCPDYWPISIFTPRFPAVRDVVVAVLVTAAFFAFTKYLEAKRYRVVLTIVFGAVVIAGLSSVQGIDIGYYAPISGDAADWRACSVFGERPGILPRCIDHIGPG